MWAPRVLDLDQLRRVPGLENLVNRAYDAPSPQVDPRLTHLSHVMEPAIERIADNVYSAIGFDSAHSTFVIGDDGVVVIDGGLPVRRPACSPSAPGRRGWSACPLDAPDDLHDR